MPPPGVITEEARMGKKVLPFIKGRRQVQQDSKVQIHQDRRTKRLRTRAAKKNQAIKEQEA